MSYVERVFEMVKQRNPAEPEFLQAVKEVLDSLAPVFERKPEYEAAGILERLVEPERQIIFRVPWVDDNGKVQVNSCLLYTSADGGGQRGNRRQGQGGDRKNCPTNFCGGGAGQRSGQDVYKRQGRS